jgi:hypothetical protein
MDSGPTQVAPPPRKPNGYTCVLWETIARDDEIDPVIVAVLADVSADLPRLNPSEAHDSVWPQIRMRASR